MNKKIIKNYIYNLSYQLLVIIVPLITTPYVSRVLGATGVGTYSYTNSITQYFILFGAIGLNLYGQREIAYKQNNKKEYSQKFWEIFCLKCLTLSLSIIFFYVMAISYRKYSSIFLIQIIDIISSIFDISWFFQGIEDFKKIVIRNFIVKISGVICIFIFIKSSNDLWLYVLCYSLTIFLGNISMWIYIPKLIQKISFRTLNLKEHIKPALMLFIPQIAVSLYTLLDKTMIGILTNNEAEVAFYEQSQKIVKIALTIVTSLGTVMLPRIANVFASKDYQKIHLYMKSTFKFVFVLGLPITFGIIGITENFVPWFFGDGYDKVVLNMIIISPIIFIIGMSNVIGTQYLLPTNRQKQYTISVICGSITNFFLNLILIPYFLSYGAAVATVIAELLVTSIQMYFVRNDFQLISIFADGLRYLLYSIIMGAVVYFAGTLMSSTVITTFIQCSMGVIVYMLLLIISKDDLIFGLLQKIKKRFAH